MQHRRDVHQLAHTLQTLAAKLLGFLVHQTGLGGSLCRAAGDDEDDVIFDELLAQMDLFSETFSRLRDSIARDDTVTMREMMRLSTQRRKYFDKDESV